MAALWRSLLFFGESVSTAQGYAFFMRHRESCSNCATHQRRYRRNRVLYVSSVTLAEASYLVRGPRRLSFRVTNGLQLIGLGITNYPGNVPMYFMDDGQPSPSALWTTQVPAGPTAGAMYCVFAANTRQCIPDLEFSAYPLVCRQGRLDGERGRIWFE